VKSPWTVLPLVAGSINYTIYAQAATLKLSHAALATQAIQISFKLKCKEMYTEYK